MEKTTLQQKLELEWQKPLEELLLDALNSHRGEPHAVRATAVELDIADSTIYKWCKQLDICTKHWTRHLEPAPASGP